MDKIYDQTKIEQKWYKFWEEEGFFKADPDSSKPAYGLLIPPPNLTGSPHLGHAMQHAILDAVARFKRIQGFDVLLLPGVDHAGIQFEGTLNKLLEKEGTSRQKLGREEWLKRAWQFKEEIYKTFHDTWTVFGLSADWSREVFTLEPKVQRAVLEEFKSFWEQNLLYKGAYIVQWCPKDQTAIEDVEMEYEERKDKLYYLQYGPLIIATTRPETKFGDTAMAVNPNDKRYEQFVGKEFEIKTLNGPRKMKVIADKAIDPKFGTGAEKVTPGHDILDYEISKRHNLEIIHVIDKSGRLTKVAGKYAGMKFQEARAAMIPELKEKGILIKEEDYVHSVPVCERCKTTVEPIISEEWFVKMKPLTQKALKRMNEINFVPKNYKKILSDWMKEIHDWTISRSLWWGHRIPVWYCQKCNPNHLVGKDKDMIISLEKPGKNCQTCGQKHWVQDEQVLDTWFSSGLWPMATLGWPQQSKEFEKYYPWQFELSAPEIKYLWIARMIMLGLHFTNKIPFENMFFHGMIRDLQGRKFSKSLGNGIDPNKLRNQWGTDSTRMALYTYSAPGRDGRASRQTMDERCKNFRNFGTKLRNIARFIIELKPSEASPELDSGFIQKKPWIPDQVGDDKLHPDDKKILDQLNKTIQEVTKNLEGFNLHLAIEKLYEFIWHQFADKYIESAKNRRTEAQPILEYVFKTSLELLHPFMPFITEELWQKLPHRGKSIMATSWPSTK
ncbi:valine--tRNA ligase [Candidatus Daviesbacteria bacterium RIFCSPHIGHO2_02_FULL_39_12]|uniref:Valine--tRNA ligase n=1 Tax=Candidatus Daviesbacteria bacterium RIFCSPHIGHO2_02_FULL_39_12 TaxID=1797770 RepID=A0A1F5J8C7_9BACT|nr:MAG: valine--tRNA ligase [Candidatus Daviesbacteria bacterium RIFCSPHIGHO2_02_FULL_39_12]